jgi:hypothetical protein
VGLFLRQQKNSKGIFGLIHFLKMERFSLLLKNNVLKLKKDE